MASVDNKKFDEWLRNEIRLAGEELVRRSENMDFSGWDLVTDISITIEIPTFTEEIQTPGIDFCFSTVNKCAIDDICQKW